MIEQDGKPVLRISGEFYGCATTRQEFSNYHFRASFKWGEKKWEPRLTELKDSGILYHSRGDFGVDYWKSWALSQEFQVIEHGIGEYWRIATSEIDIRADPKAPGAVAPKWNPRAPWMAFAGSNNNALAGSDEDRPGEWNTLELVCFEDRCVHIANGKVVMALKNARYTGWRQGRADDGRQAADPERGRGGVLSGHRDPRDSGHAARSTSSISRNKPSSAIHCLKSNSAFHDHVDVLQRRDVLQRVGLHGDEVAELAGLRCVPTSLLHPMYCAATRRGRLDRLHRRHAARHHDGKLARVESVRKHRRRPWRTRWARRPCTALVKAWRWISVVSGFLRRNSSGQPAFRPSVSM